MKWNVGRKIGAGYVLALAIFLIVGIVTYQNTAELIETSAWVEHTREVLTKLEEIYSQMDDAQTGERGFIITGEERYLEPYESGVEALPDVVEAVGALTADDPNQQKRHNALDLLIEENLSFLQETIDLRRSEGFEAAQAIVLTDQGKRLMADIRGLIDEMKAEENELLNQRLEKSTTSAQTTQLVIVYAVIVSLIVLSLVGFLITQNLSKPLQGISSMAEQIAAGDLAINAPTDNRRDEVGALGHAFAKMIEYLQETAASADEIAAGNLTLEIQPRAERDLFGHAMARMVRNLRDQTAEIQKSVTVLNSAASELSSTSAQSAGSAAETATLVNETTTTVEEVKQTSEVSSQKAKEVSEKAQRAMQISQTGEKLVDETIQVMNGLQEQMGAVAESVVRLSEQSQTIGEIITSVNDLAEQSNLLSVNAAIEAAKAGEQGKGFTVVAQEIKSLAEQSKQATTQVQTILNDVQKATSNAVMATEQGSKAVELGVKQSAETGESIRMLAESIGEAAQAGTQIAASSRQQLVGMDQVAHAMESINQASQETAASMKQMETTAQGLTGLGQKLDRLAKHYAV